MDGFNKKQNYSGFLVRGVLPPVEGDRAGPAPKKGGHPFERPPSPLILSINLEDAVIDNHTLRPTTFGHLKAQPIRAAFIMVNITPI